MIEQRLILIITLQMRLFLKQDQLKKIKTLLEVSPSLCQTNFTGTIWISRTMIRYMSYLIPFKRVTVLSSSSLNFLILLVPSYAYYEHHDQYVDISSSSQLNYTSYSMRTMSKMMTTCFVLTTLVSFFVGLCNHLVGSKLGIVVFEQKAIRNSQVLLVLFQQR